jgi:hypothetical protein
VAHPWMLTAAAVAAAVAGGGQQRLLCLAPVRVGPLTRWLALGAHGPGWQGGGSGARFAWLWQRGAAELFGRWRQGGIHGNVRALAAAHPGVVGSSRGGSSRGGAAALALLGLRWGWAAELKFNSKFGTTEILVVFQRPCRFRTGSYDFRHPS